MNDAQDRYPQNDPDRAEGLISDAQGEFVREHPGGAFDPRAFRPGRPAAPAEPAGQDQPAGEPPMTGDRMAPPGGEAAKADRSGNR
ncbi:hypothetical protein Acy02nite_51100 [Actinoplanes cyaneus]|uniref:Uncharacterized protein n=1 Tax=Actinoplanes cyaneus TaxID=52696 RepID=A0A919IJZ7_9ACTN|nr:hypothetical protein [Actinoplanes cyaneus]MCW2141166.1 hypothetical protein [Actinoplanes cyaneus]GID67229.1 hypothetical protein Acy02nite_51100 [Actinoplanes cyaneus]